MEKLEWLDNNPQEAKAMSERTLRFGQEHMTFDKAAERAAKVIIETTNLKFSK